MIQVNDPELKRTLQSYHLKCKVLVKEISYLDEQSKETVMRSEEMVFLVPELNTQGSLFLTAWLPETVEENHEVIFEAGHPIHGVFRGAVQRKNEKCGEHHIFVMSRGAEEDLKAMRGKTVFITALPANEEVKGDMMRDFDLADDKSDQIVSYE